MKPGSSPFSWQNGAAMSIFGGTQIAPCVSVDSIEPGLRYLDANHVETPAGRLEGAVLVSPTKVRLGKLDGILVDPLRRQARYYVVQTKRGFLSSHHCLLPLTASRLDRDHHTLEVEIEADEMRQLHQVEPDDLPRFSDEDLLTAIFHPAAR